MAVVKAGHDTRTAAHLLEAVLRTYQSHRNLIVQHLQDEGVSYDRAGTWSRRV
jgi:hypothetical protein